MADTTSTTQGQVSTTLATIFTAPGSTGFVVGEFTLSNLNTVAVSVQIARKGTTFTSNGYQTVMIMPAQTINGLLSPGVTKVLDPGERWGLAPGDTIAALIPTGLAANVNYLISGDALS